MKITKLSFNEFIHFSPKIHYLIEHSNQSNIFLTPEWIQIWWKHWSTEDDEFFTLIVEENKEIIGCMPLYIQKQTLLKFKTVKTVQFINGSMGAADHLDIISLKNREQEIGSLLLNYLFDNKEVWDILSLDNLSSDNYIASYFYKFKNTQFKLKINMSFLCPYLAITSDWESFLKTKSKNYRYQTRAKRRKFESNLNGSFQQCSSVEEINQCFKTIATFNPKRFSEQGDFSKFSLKKFQDFHIQVATSFLSKGWLDLSYLNIDNKIVAVIYNYNFKNKAFYFNIAFDPSYSKYSIGRVLMGYSIENAYNSKLKEFDFLRGEHHYKDAWTDTKRQDIKILVFKNNLILNLNFKFEQYFSQFKGRLKNYVPKSFMTRIKSFMTNKLR